MFKRCNAKMLLVIMAAYGFCISPIRAQQESLTINLQDAIERARINSPQFQASSLEVEIAHLDRYLAKSNFFPTAGYLNQYVYTQGNGTPSGVFIGNDGVHVYNSQLNVHQELFSPLKLAAYRRSIAAEAAAAARRDVVLQGVVSTVFQDYYAIVIAERHLLNAQKSLKEAEQFLEITEKLEREGEGAHADVIKAQLSLEQRKSEVEEAGFSKEKPKIALALLMFSGPIPEFSVVDDLNSVGSLLPFNQIESLAKETNPDLRAAQQMLSAEKYGVAEARSEYYPSLSLDYFFGINNNRFATRDPEGNNRLGSVAQATLNIPFSWWTTRSKVRQAEIKRKQADLNMSLTIRELNANLRTSYLEAQTAFKQLELLRHTADLADESLRLTNLRYEAGEATVLEVVDAQSTLAQARNNYDDGLARYRVALAGIQALTGNY